MRMSTREARQRFAELIQSAQSGRTIEITRRGKIVARVTPARQPQAIPLPDMTSFHQRLTISGRPLSRTVVAARLEARY